MKKLSLFMTALIVAVATFACSSDSVSVSISPKSYDFGDVSFGAVESAEFTLTNKYKVEIKITTVEIAGANAGLFTITDGDTPGTVVSGNSGTHTITVDYKSEVGKAEAFIYVFYNDDKDNPKTIEIKLKGNGTPAPIFVSSATSNSFGIVNLGIYVDYTITITNDGTEDMHITDIQFGGTDFKIETGWSSTEIAITPASTYDLIVRFEPASKGILQDTMSITHDAFNETSPFEIALDGEGADPKFTTNITGTPPEIDFGGVFKDVTAYSTKFEITNTGTGDLEITNMQFSGSDFAFISGWSGSPVTITAGNKAELEVEFLPTTTGVRNETLSIFHNASNVASPFDVNLKGEATDNYTPERFTKGMSPISGGVSVNLLDDDYQAIPIGFTFNFYGQNYTQVYVCSNGFAGFGSPLDYDWGEDFYPLPQTTTSNNCIYLFNLDLNPELGGSIAYKLEGSGTNKVLVIEFKGLTDFDQIGSFTGQIRLYESTNIIELHYDTSIVWTTVNWSTNIIGIENQDGTKGVDWDGVNSNPANTLPTDNIRYK